MYDDAFESVLLLHVIMYLELWSKHTLYRFVMYHFSIVLFCGISKFIVACDKGKKYHEMEYYFAKHFRFCMCHFSS